MNKQINTVIDTTVSRPTLRESVSYALNQYFENLEGQEPQEIYDMVMHEVEEPMLKAVMEFTRNNQSRAATIMGLNRGTLRKKLKQFDML